jgi:hypothetical protein
LFVANLSCIYAKYERNMGVALQQFSPQVTQKGVVILDDPSSQSGKR